MRLWLAWGFRIGRQHGSAPLVKRQLAEFSHSPDANRRLCSSLSAAWLTPTAQQKRESPGANLIAPACTVGGHLLLKLSYKPQLESRRDFSSGRNRTGADAPLKLDVHARVTAWMRSKGPNGSRNKEVRKRSGALVKPSQDKMSVHHAGPADAKLAAKGTTDPLSDDVSAETWQLFNEYNVPNTLEKIFGVLVRATESPSKQIQLTLYGRNTAKLWRMLVNPSLKLHVHKRVTAWLLAEGLNGLRVKDILKRTGALVKPSVDEESVLLVGPSESVLAAKSIIEGVHTRHARVPRATCCWLTIKAKGADFARSEELSRKFDTHIDMGPYKDHDDPDQMVDLTVIGEHEENVEDVLTIRKFDTCVLLYPLDDKDDPSCMVELVVLGEREENVDQVFAAIGITSDYFILYVCPKYLYT